MVKVISLSERAYKVLRRLKKEGMGFSDVILTYLGGNLAEKTESLEDFIRWAESRKTKVSRNSAHHLGKI